ncbi:MAG: hypothetical protein MZV49_26085 [Rhodopseudomonas palustris]|nr:hypothetical protein [Rhodopseudomonas palustris]
MNLFNVERPKWQAADALKPGRHTVVFDFTLQQQGEVPFGHGGTGVMSIDGAEAGAPDLAANHAVHARLGRDL